jgi:hypothetical protein
MYANRTERPPAGMKDNTKATHRFRNLQIAGSGSMSLRHLTLVALGTTLVPSNCLFMAKRPNKPAPIIPEPSPRFAFWSGVAAVILLTIVMTLDYANGWLR